MLTIWTRACICSGVLPDERAIAMADGGLGGGSLHDHLKTGQCD